MTATQYYQIKLSFRDNEVTKHNLLDDVSFDSMIESILTHRHLSQSGFNIKIDNYSVKLKLYSKDVGLEAEIHYSVTESYNISRL